MLNIKNCTNNPLWRLRFPRLRSLTIGHVYFNDANRDPLVNFLEEHPTIEELTFINENSEENWIGYNTFVSVPKIFHGPDFLPILRTFKGNTAAFISMLVHKPTFARTTLRKLELSPISLFTAESTKKAFAMLLARDMPQPPLPVLKELHLDLRRWEYVHTKDVIEMMELCAALCGDSLEVWSGGEPPILMTAEIMGPLFGKFKKLREIHFCVCVIPSYEEAICAYMAKIAECCPSLARICVDDHKKRRTAYRYDIFRKGPVVEMELMIEMDEYRAYQ